MTLTPCIGNTWRSTGSSNWRTYLPWMKFKLALESMRTYRWESRSCAWTWMEWGVASLTMACKVTSRVASAVSSYQVFVESLVASKHKTFFGNLQTCPRWNFSLHLKYYLASRCRLLLQGKLLDPLRRWSSLECVIVEGRTQKAWCSLPHILHLTFLL